MSQPTSRDSLPVVPLIIAGVVVIVGLALIGVTLLLVFSRSGAGGQGTQAANNPPVATARPVIIYTPTPLPTSTPTDLPTSTPTETLTPTLLSTNTFVPATRVPPTAAPTDPPPTDIPATAVPLGRGWITDIKFEVPKTEVNTGAHIVFNFHFFNARGLDWDFGCVGVKVYDVAGNFIKNQWSLGNSSLVHMSFNNALDWSDSVKDIHSTGSYVFQLWIRYDKALCNDAGGDWENLSGGGIQVNVH